MSIRIQVILLILLFLALAVIIGMVRKQVVDLKFVLPWMAGDVVLIVFSAFPSVMDRLAALLGIYSPVNMIFFIGFVLSMMIIFSMTVVLSRLTASMRRIAQEVALLEEENDRLRDAVGRAAAGMQNPGGEFCKAAAPAEETFEHRDQ